MKKISKILLVCFIITAIMTPAYAINIGTYKTESEYGLLDGFKFNWKRQNKNQKFIEVRENPTKEDSEKEYRDYKNTEYERTKFMYEGKSII